MSWEDVFLMLGNFCNASGPQHHNQSCGPAVAQIPTNYVAMDRQPYTCYVLAEGDPPYSLNPVGGHHALTGFGPMLPFAMGPPPASEFCWNGVA
jgi:hypothetical protein